MTALLPDFRPGTDEDRRRISDEVYRRNTDLHATAHRRAMADAVIQRDLEHAGQLDTFAALCAEIWSAHPGPEGHALAMARLAEFGAAWAATEARHDTAIADALHRLDSMEGAR